MRIDDIKNKAQKETDCEKTQKSVLLWSFRLGKLMQSRGLTSLRSEIPLYHRSIFRPFSLFMQESALPMATANSLPEQMMPAQYLQLLQQIYEFLTGEENA